MKENYERLLELQQQYPELTYDNHGYDEISDEIVAKHKEQIEEISNILDQEIPNFVRFQNFKIQKDGTIQIRCQIQYDTDHSFIGVGYFDLNTFK